MSLHHIRGICRIFLHGHRMQASTSCARRRSSPNGSLVVWFVNIGREPTAKLAGLAVDVTDATSRRKRVRVRPAWVVPRTCIAPEVAGRVDEFVNPGGCRAALIRETWFVSGNMIRTETLAGALQSL